MPLVWVCEVPHLSQRFSVATAGNGAKAYRRLRLPDSAYLDSLLKDADVGFDPDAIPAVKSYTLIGLANIEQGHTFGSPLDIAPNPEADVWLRYFIFPCDGYTVNIRGFFELSESLEIHCARMPNGDAKPLHTLRNVGGPFIPYDIPADLPSLTGRVAGVACTLEDTLQRWNCFEDLQNPIMACPVFSPISTLIAGGSWQSLFWLGRWKIPVHVFPNFPSQEWLAGRKGEHDTAWGEKVDLHAVQFEELAANLQRWAPTIIAAAADDEDAEAESNLLALAVRWLKRVAAGFRKPQASAGTRRTFTSTTLLHGALLSNLLRSTAYILAVCAHGAELLLPDMGLDMIVRGTMAFPSSSSLRRAQFSLDIAHMLTMRGQVANEASVRYGWADSSPQSGRNWLMPLYSTCPSVDVTDVAAVARGLTRGRHDFIDHHESEDLSAPDTVAMNQQLASSLRMHTCIPVALGSGRATVEDKVAALLQSAALECPDINALGTYLGSFRSWTTDMGIEMSLAMFKCQNWKSLLPCWMRDAGLASDVHEDADDQAAPANTLPVELMPQALIIPGPLHALHNLAADLHSRLSWWDKFWDHLKSLEALVALQHNRERFVATCLLGTPQASKVTEFVAFSARLYEKRWGAVVTFLRDLNPLLQCLVETWSQQRFLLGRGCMAALDGDDSKSLASDVSAALDSVMFRDYFAFSLGLHRVLDGLEAWIEGCACHDHLFRDVSHRKRRRRLAKLFHQDRRHGTGTCPLRGRRAAEFAAGEFENILECLLREKLDAVPVRLSDGMSEADRGVIVRDVELAKAYLKFGVQAKFAHWQKLPWLLCGMAHHWQSEARCVARECVRFFDTSMADGFESADHHMQTNRLLGHGALRSEVDHFIQTGDMAPALRREVDVFALIPVSERYGEGPHRNVKIAKKHVKIGGVAVSLAVRKGQMNEELERNRDYWPALEAAFECARNPKDAVAALRLSGHPVFQQLIGRRCSKSTAWLSALAKVLYRCDLQTQFADLSEQRKQYKVEQDYKKRRFEQMHGDGRPPRAEFYDEILQRAAIDHLRSTLSADDFISVPHSDEFDMSFEACDNRAKRARLPDDVAGEELEADVDALVAVPAEDEEVDVHARSVFRVLHAYPHRLKQPPVPVAAGRAYSLSQLAVVVHDILSDADQPVVAATSARPMLLDGLTACPLPILRDDVHVWSVDSGIQYSLPCTGDLDPKRVREIVTHMVRLGALPGSKTYYAAPEDIAPIMDALTQRGSVRRDAEDGHDVAPSFQLTAVGVAALRHVVALTNPVSICSIRPGLPVEDYSKMELILKLEDEGWTWAKLPKRIPNRLALTYTPGQERVWYSASATVVKEYLQALVQADDIFAMGVSGLA